VKQRPNEEFLFQDQSTFKRELGFLMDIGYIENVNLDLFSNRQNIITQAGELLIMLRERLNPFNPLLEMLKPSEPRLDLTASPSVPRATAAARFGARQTPIVEALTPGHFPHIYLKRIYEKKMKRNLNADLEILSRDQSAFKRELGFLMDIGYIENANLNLFSNNQNILDKLDITRAGELLITLHDPPNPFRRLTTVT
jgi:hypothetical protein